MRFVLVPDQVLGQGYHGAVHAKRAAMRGLRWLRSPRHQGQRPPRHIQDKLRLCRVDREE